MCKKNSLVGVRLAPFILYFITTNRANHIFLLVGYVARIPRRCHWAINASRLRFQRVNTT